MRFPLKKSVLPILLFPFVIFSSAALEEDKPELPTLEPLTVESTVLPGRTPDELLDPVEILAGLPLDRRRAGNIGKLLGHELGVANSSFGPGAGRPVIRGQGGPRVQVLENGIRTMDLSTVSADHAVTVDPLVARKVEVLKGPATLLYGTGSSGGVVNVLNHRMPREFEEGVTGHFSVSRSDNAAARLASGNVILGSERLALQADAGLERTGDFTIPGYPDIEGEGRRRVLESSSIRNWSAGISAAYAGENSFLGVGISRFDNDYGIPEVIDPADPEFERITLEQTRFDLRGELLEPFPLIRRARVAFGRNRYHQEEAEFEDGIRELETTFSNREWDLRSDLWHEPIGPLTGVVGVQVTHRRFEAREEDEDEEFFVPPTRTSSWAVFLVEEVPMEFGRIEAGGRYEHNQSDPESGPRVRFNLLSLSGGVIWDLDDKHHVKLRFNRAERAPAPEELFSHGRHGATSNFEVGDPDIRTERSHEIDLGLDRHGDSWEWRVNLFHNRIQNYIFQEFQVDGQGEIILVNDDGEPTGRQRNRLVHFRQRDARFHGLEAEIRFPLSTGGPVHLESRLFGDYVRGRLRDTNESLPRITPTRFGISLDAFRGPFDGNVEWIHTRTQRRIGPGETQTAGYTTLALSFGYTVQWAEGYARFFLQGRNLLNEEIRLHTSFLKEEAPQPGRSLTAGVRVDF